MLIKLKDFVYSSRGSISVPSADITQVSTKSANINELYAIPYIEIQMKFPNGVRIG